MDAQQPAFFTTSIARHYARSLSRSQFVQGIVGSFPDNAVEVQRCFDKVDWDRIGWLFTGTRTEPMPGPDGHINTHCREIAAIKGCQGLEGYPW